MIRIWLDDVRPAPEGYLHAHSVNEAINLIHKHEGLIELIDCDHDLGAYAKNGGDGIGLLDYLVRINLFLPIRLHTMNPVGRANMQRMIDRYWP